MPKWREMVGENSGNRSKHDSGAIGKFIKKLENLAGFSTGSEGKYSTENKEAGRAKYHDAGIWKVGTLPG